MIVERKPCDVNFDQAETAYRKAGNKLQGAGLVCIRQAGLDLARACRLFKDPAIASLGAILSENLRGGVSAIVDQPGLDNVREACHRFSSARRGGLQHQDPAPEDLMVISAMHLEEACLNMITENLSDLSDVGPATVRSRASSQEVLYINRERV